MWHEYWKELKRSHSALAGAVILAIFVMVSAVGPWISPQDPLKQDLYHRLERPSPQHALGTDELGRDILSRVFYGARISLEVGFVAVGIALLTGSLLGLVAGYYGGAADMIIMRIMDLMLAFPSILLAIVIVSVLGP